MLKKTFIKYTCTYPNKAADTCPVWLGRYGVAKYRVTFHIKKIKPKKLWRILISPNLCKTICVFPLKMLLIMIDKESLKIYTLLYTYI